MPDFSMIALFASAAFVLAILPGPGLFYVVGRTLSGGRRAGLASVAGTQAGAMIHVLGGAIGVSAILMASATAFTVLKWAGAIYLVYLGISTWRTAGNAFSAPHGEMQRSLATTFRRGFLVEATNPKTAIFFLSLMPQFIDPARGSPAFQFLTLGTLALIIMTANAAFFTFAAGLLRRFTITRPLVVAWFERTSGAIIGGLGISLLFVRRQSI